MEATQEQARRPSAVARLARDARRAMFEKASRTTLLDEESVVRLRRIQMVGPRGVIGQPQ